MAEGVDGNHPLKKGRGRRGESPGGGGLSAAPAPTNSPPGPGEKSKQKKSQMSPGCRWGQVGLYVTSIEHARTTVNVSYSRYILHIHKYYYIFSGYLFCSWTCQWLESAIGIKDSLALGKSNLYLFKNYIYFFYSH